MSSEARKFVTYQDILALPDTVIGEIIAGELVVSPRPGPRHVHAASSLGGDIVNPFQKGKGGPGGWWILDEPEIHLQGDVLVPDLAGWRKEVIPILPTAKSYLEIAPQWVCEVLSPSTAGFDRVKKLPIYAREKVDHVWLIDPVVKTLEVYLRNNLQWILLNSFVGEDKIRTAPFEAIEIDLGSLWLPD